MLIRVARCSIVVAASVLVTACAVSAGDPAEETGTSAEAIACGDAVQPMAWATSDEGDVYTFEQAVMDPQGPCAGDVANRTYPYYVQQRTTGTYWKGIPVVSMSLSAECANLVASWSNVSPVNAGTMFSCKAFIGYDPNGGCGGGGCAL